MRKMVNECLMMVVIVAILGATLFQNTRFHQLKDEVVTLNEKLAENVTITRVVNIYNDGEGGAQSLSLTPQGWLDFMRTYPGYGCCFSNFDFEDMFTFTEVKVEYPEEVLEFFEKEKTSFMTWSPINGYEDIFARDFLMCYQEYRDGIKIIFCNPEDELQVEYEFRGAQHAKEVHINGTSKYYLVFEDANANLMAICPWDNMKAYQLTALTTQK